MLGVELFGRAAACKDIVSDASDKSAPANSTTTASVDLIVELVIDAESYRFVAQRAIDMLHEQECEIRRLRSRQRDLLVQYRRVRMSAVRP